MKVKNDSQHVLSILTMGLLAVLLTSGLLYGQTVTVGGALYSGRNVTGWVPNTTGTNTGASTGAIYVPDPSIAPVFGASVMVQNQHSGGAFITYATVVGNTWSATVPVDGDYIVMVSAPGHDLTSREFTVDAAGGITHPTFDPNYDEVGSPETFDIYLPPLFAEPDGTPDPLHELPPANLLVFAFYDKTVNGEPDDFPEDLALNGVVWYVTSEEGDTLAAGVTGSQPTITTADGVVIANTRGLYYFTELEPGEVIATSTADYVYLTGDPLATSIDIGFGPPVDFSVIPENVWTLPGAEGFPDIILDLGWDASTVFYANYTEEGGFAWDPKLFPGDPGTEAGGGFLIWHSYVEKLGQITAANVEERFGAGATLAGATTITGILQDADAPNLEAEEPFPQKNIDNPGVSLNRIVADGLIVLFTNSETIGVTPVATIEPDPVTGVFTFTDVPPGNYKMMMFDLKLMYVWSQTQVTVTPGTPIVFGPISLLVPRFGGRGQGFVYEIDDTVVPPDTTPVAGAKVHIRYKSGSIRMTETTDATGWYNFDFLPEIEVMGHIDVELPTGYRGYIRDQVFFPIGRPLNNSIGLTPDVGYIVEDLGFDHLPGTGDAGEGNLFLDCEDLNGNGILDPGEDAGLDRKLGTFDAGEGNGLLDCEDIGLDGVAMSGDKGEFNGFIDPKPADLIVCGDALSDTTLLGFAVECDTVTHNGMSRNIQWLTANYRADLYIEKIPATVGHINGFVWNDHLARGTWLGDGVYDPEEERTMHGVTIELWDATMTTLIADTVTGKFDKAATKAQGWVQAYTFPPDELGGVFVGPQIGYYEFRDVPPGTYKVKMIPPAGFSPSDLLHPAGIATVTVGAGARNDVNFGVNTLVPLAGEIEGGVFDDVNIDGRGGPFTPDPSDVTSLLFAEKAGIPHVPVGVYDHLGYNLGVGFMGNPLCFADAPDSLVCTAWDALGNCTAADTLVGTPQCPPGEDPIQKPEMERRFAPGVHIYAGNDAAFDGVCPNYLPLILPYTFGQGKFKFEADWSLMPTAIPLNPGCNIDPLISMTEPVIIDPFAPPPPAPIPGRRLGRRAPNLASSVASVTLSPGDVYRVQGLGFGDAQGFQTVTLSGQKLTVQAWTDTYIDVEIPTDAISGPIVVTATTGHSNALKVDINYSASRANYLQKRSVYVDASNAGAEDGSEAHPYNTIQEALDNLPGKSPRYVFIAAGTYNELVHIKDDDVYLIGCGPHETVINGLPAQLDIFHQGASSGAGPVIFIGKGGKTGALENISISGLTVTGGTVNANDLGCGIFGDYGNQNIDINTCRIYQNGGYYGGGIWLHYSNHNVQIWSNIIAENGNFGGYGGGISVNDEPEYDDLHHGQPEHIGDDYTPGPPPGTYEIYNNIIFHNWSADLGGGICLYEIKDHLKVYGNVMLENKSEDHGGALFFEDCGPVDVWGNAFIRNYSPDDGGAISFEDVADTLAHINIWNNLFAENIADDHGENTARGGALAFDDIRDANVFNNTFVGNIVAGSAGPAGGAIDSERHGHEYNGTDGVYMAPGYSHPKIYNNIIWDNWRLEYDQKGAASDEEDLDASWGKNYRWTLDQLHVDNPHLQPEWEKQNNSNSFGYVRYNIISGGYDYTNLLPTADAGPDQLVIDEDRDHFEDVWLDGSGSFDPDGPITSYDWFDNKSPIATGVNPLVNLSVGTHYIDLVIWDDRGGTATDQVVIDVGRPKDDKNRPVANAGPDQTVIDIEDDGVEDVTLDGSGSTTPEGAIVSYVWTEDGSQIATGVTAVVNLSVGTHVIKLTVTDDRDLRAGDEVVVDVRPGGASFAAIHDSYVKSSSPNKNFGSKTNVRIRGGNPAYTAYLKFDVTGLTATVKKAILLLYVRQASAEGGTIYAVSNDYIGTTTPWEEDGLTASNAPLISDTPLSSVGAAEMDTWVRFDVTSAITGDGTYSFGIANADFSDVKYSSKEGSYPPELVIVTESGAGVNQSPIAHAGADQAVTDTDNNATEDVQLDGSASFDLDGTLSGYVWSEGGSQIATGANPLVSLGVGTHFIDLTVTDDLGATGTDQVMVTVNASGGGTSVAVSFTPSDDAQVKSSSENKNFASKSTSRVRGGNPEYNAYLKFNLTGLTGAVQKATLRLFAKSAGSDGGNVYAVSNNYHASSTPWTEDGLKYTNAPLIAGAPVASVGPAETGQWVEVDVTSAVSGNGEVSFGIAKTLDSSVKYSTKEGSDPPELVVEFSAPLSSTRLAVASDGTLMLRGLPPQLRNQIMGFARQVRATPEDEALKARNNGTATNLATTFQNNTAGNLDVDPQFVDPSGLNWRLQAGSPAIDQADAAMGPDVDLEVLLRTINNGMIDMGAFEWRPNSPVVLRIPTGILGQITIPAPGSPGPNQ